MLGNDNVDNVGNDGNDGRVDDDIFNKSVRLDTDGNSELVLVLSSLLDAVVDDDDVEDDDDDDDDDEDDGFNTESCNVGFTIKILFNVPTKLSVSSSQHVDQHA